MRVKIWGCRGSLPAPLKPPDVEEKIVQAIHGLPAIDTQDLDAVRAYVRSLSPLQRGTAGGNTSCVEVQAAGKTLVVDAGTGIRELGLELMKGPCGRGEGELHLMFSHLHWDHVQGFPFFMPAFIPGNRITIYGLHDIHKALLDQQRAPSFPVPMSTMAASIDFVTLTEGEPFAVGDVRINTIRNAHPGHSYSYRFEHGETVFVFASDSEYQELNDTSVRPYIEFFRDADALIFDAQYTLGEGWLKEDWGHSSAMIGVDMAVAAGVKRLILFHHDPTHDDNQLQRIQADAEAYRVEKPNYSPCEILIAYEGLALDLSPSDSSSSGEPGEGADATPTHSSVFDEHDVHHLQDQLSQLDGQGQAIAKGPIIDLSRVETLSTASLKLLVKQQLERGYTSMLLAAPTASAMRVIELAGFADFFAIYPTVEAASLAAYARESLELPGQILGGRYRVERVVDKGTTGTVLCAMNQPAGIHVALKVIDPTFGEEALDRLLSQRPELVQLQHPCLIRVHDLVREEQVTYLVEDYDTGETLDALLRQGNGALRDGEPGALEIVRAVLDALEHLHGQGLVHGNLKPANVFIDDSGIRVGGLGLGHLDEGQNLLKAPVLRQTAAYLAPEQILGQAIDPRTDLYALGIMLYELFTGRKPFEGSEQEVLEAHVAVPPLPPREINPRIPVSLNHLVLKLLAKNQADRYASISEVRQSMLKMA